MRPRPPRPAGAEKRTRQQRSQNEELHGHPGTRHLQQTVTPTARKIRTQTHPQSTTQRRKQTARLSPPPLQTPGRIHRLPQNQTHPRRQPGLRTHLRKGNTQPTHTRQPRQTQRRTPARQHAQLLRHERSRQQTQNERKTRTRQTALLIDHYSTNFVIDISNILYNDWPRTKYIL